MANSKFAGIFDEAAAEAPDAPEAGTKRPVGRIERAAPTRATMGRPGGKGKASNPDWDQTTVYLKRSTKQAAKALLVARSDGQDLSEVLEHLLAGWIKRQN